LANLQRHRPERSLRRRAGLLGLRFGAFARHQRAPFTQPGGHCGGRLRRCAPRSLLVNCAFTPMCSAASISRSEICCACATRGVHR